MLSIVMPYWDRQAQANVGLARLADLYAEMDLEIIVVDDGNPVPFVMPALPWASEIVRMPAKTEALNPCVAFNAGVKASRGDMLVLTNPEIVHRIAILPKMLATAERMGERAYVAAACWSTDAQRWYAHSKHKSPGCGPLPPKAGLHFCAVLSRSLYDLAGGFNEAYRQGAGWEDNDFLFRLQAVGAKFKILDDCIVEHVRTNTRWHGSHARNEALFHSLWPATGVAAQRELR